MRRLLPLVLAAACAAAGAADLPAHPFVSTTGKAQVWVAPDIAALYFDTGAQNASAELAATSLDELEKLAPALLEPPAAGKPALPPAEGIKPYSVPPAIPFAQSVTAVFRLAGASADATTTRKPAR